ncbi:MAG: hypothetical protein AMS16_01430 [Planctomycetes bacterium DG_58]|nr:MAG: hypothetical protein AMS16_01430 [Planctomycetes bacterium DG_58]KPL04240.1 MAG: hypothetical protein AMK75_01355 [Planctomycetes bacterium SM23_65]
MEPFDLRKLKRPRLIELAGHFKIKRRHRLRKRDLIKKLEPLLAELPEKVALGLLRPQLAESSSRLARPTPQQQPQYVDRGAPIPLHYGQDRITVLVRDPNCLHVYWELEGPRREEVMREHGRDVFNEASWVLRLLTDRDGTQDTPIVVEGCNWYLPVADDRNYTVEIGIIIRGGRFIRFATSNPVNTPRMGISPDTTSEWMRVDEEFRVTRPGVKGPEVGAFADTLAERFRTPDMSSRFLGASGRVPGSRNIRTSKEKSSNQ